MDYYQGEKSPVRTWIPLRHYLPTNSRTFWIGHFFCLLTKRNTELLFLRDETIGWSKEMQKRKQKERVYAACKDSANALSSFTLCKPIIQNLGRSQPLRWVYTTDRNRLRSPLFRGTQSRYKKAQIHASIRCAVNVLAITNNVWTWQRRLYGPCWPLYEEALQTGISWSKTRLAGGWETASYQNHDGWLRAFNGISKKS